MRCRFIPRRQSCLPRYGPLGAYTFGTSGVGKLNLADDLAHLQFENSPRIRSFPVPLIIRFTWQNCRACSSYPEGNFGGNQLLDGSMSLSPLYPGLTNDLHVSTAAGFQRGFPRLHPTQEKITIFRVSPSVLYLPTFSRRSGGGRVASSRSRCHTLFSFNAPRGFDRPQDLHVR